MRSDIVRAPNAERATRRPKAGMEVLYAGHKT